MSVDVKIRITLLVASVAVSAFAALAASHGVYLGFLDGVGGTGP